MRRWAVGAWIVFLLACVGVISRTPFTADLSAFLPRSPTPAQQILIEQLRDGIVSRLMLIGLEGADPKQLAEASRGLAKALRGRRDFASVENGELAGIESDREFLWRNRYLLSPAVAPERFTADALHRQLEAYLRLLDSPAGLLARRVLPADPSGELLRILERFEGATSPPRRDGVWFSPEGARALLLAQTRAAGDDIDAQERALNGIRHAFEPIAGASGVRMLVTGPGVFAVQSRAVIKSDVVRLSLVATALVAALLLLLFRSPRLLGLGLLPVASGALAGVAAVGLGFETVHGITLGFGVTLIGEGVDYAIYLFTQSAPGIAPDRALDRIWPTLRLGVLTSLCGFGAMLFSGFTGLAQLGLFSVTGLIVAAAVTRWVLPVLMPAGFAATAATAMTPIANAVVKRAAVLRFPLLIAAALSLVLLATREEPAWSDDLASLGAISRADQRLDERLRRDIGAPDVRYLVVIHAGDREAALQASEAVVTALGGAVREGLLAGIDSPSDWLPSLRAQRARQAALPDTGELRANLRQALKGLPYRPEIFEAFLKDAAAARSQPPVDRRDLDGTRFGLKVDTLLVERKTGWMAMLPLRGVGDPDGVARRLPTTASARSVLLDLKRESVALYRTYRGEALQHALLGAAAIALLLLATLRSPRRVAGVLAPLAAAVLIAACALVIAEGSLTIFHLVGLLLVVAVGSNYSLFFEARSLSRQDRERTVVSLLFAGTTTVIAFGVLAFSRVPVLQAIGTTVGLGALLALVAAASLARRNEHAD